MSASGALTPVEWPESERAAFVGVPVMSLAEVREACGLLAHHDEAAAQDHRSMEALRQWAGPGLDGVRLGALMVEPLPPELERGLARGREVQALQSALDLKTEEWRTEGQALRNRLVSLTERSQRERQEAELRTRSLQHLLPLAQQVLAAQSRLTLLRARQAEPRGRPLAGLWKAVSGQAAALQRDIDQAERDRSDALRIYRMKVTSLALSPEQRAEVVASLLHQENVRQEGVSRQADTQRRGLEDAVRQVGERALAARAHLNHCRFQLVDAWRDLPQRYGVPQEWSDWEALWERREGGQVLWRQWHEAQAEVHEASRRLSLLWAGWLPGQQGVDALRQLLPLAEAAALARQAQEEREAERHRTERTHREHLLSLPLSRQGELEAARRAAARQAQEDARHRAQNAKRHTLLLLLHERGPLLVAAECRAWEAQAREERRLEEQQRQEERHSRLSLVALLQARESGLREEQRRLEEQARQNLLVTLAQPPARLLEGAAAVSDGALPHQVVDAGAADAPATRPESEAVQGPSSSGVPSLATQRAVRNMKPSQGSGGTLPSAASPAPAKPLPSPSLELAQLEIARSLLVRHGAAAAQAAMCKEALEEWAGPGLDALLLAALVSQPLPHALAQALAEWEHVRQPARENPTGPQQHERRVLRWETTWTELHRTLGVPALPEHWQRLWTSRAKAQSLWSQWEQAQERRHEQEAGMASLWVGWPSTQQSVAALRRALKEAEAITRTMVESPSSAGTRKQAAPLSPRTAPPAPPEGGGRPIRTEKAETGEAQAVGAGTGKTSTPNILNAAKQGSRWRLEEIPDGPRTLWGSIPLGNGWVLKRISDKQPSLDAQRLGATDVYVFKTPEGGFGMTKDIGVVKQYGISGHKMKLRDVWAGKYFEFDDSTGERTFEDFNPHEVQEHTRHETGHIFEHKGSHYDFRKKAGGDRGLLAHATKATLSRRPGGGFELIKSETGNTTLGFYHLANITENEELHKELQGFATRQGTKSKVFAFSSSDLLPQLENEQQQRDFDAYMRPRMGAFMSDIMNCKSEFDVMGVLMKQYTGFLESKKLVGGVPPAGHPVPRPPLPGQVAAPQPLSAPLPGDPVSAKPLASPSRPNTPSGDTLWQKTIPALKSTPGERPATEPPPDAPGHGPTLEVGAALLPRPAKAPAAPSVPPAIQRPAAAEPGRHPIVPPPRPSVSVQPYPAVRQAALSVPPRPAGPVPPLPTTPQRIRMPSPVLPGQPRSPAAPEPAALPGRLTRRQRAEREAVRISEQYDWKKGFLLLADALDRKNWGQLRVSIEREIALGMMPEEFELMMHLRAYWHEQTHFQSPHTSRYDSLPWGLGLALIRRSAGVPCLDEMIILLDRLYEYAGQVCSRRALPAFAQRLGVILNQADPDVDLEYWLCAQEARCSFR